MPVSLQTVTITDPFSAANQQACGYTHDDLGRLASVDCGAGTWHQTFQYDSFGNLAKDVPAGATGTSFQASYSSATNRLASIGNLIPAYDGNGNLTYDGNTYAWDEENHLLVVNGTA